jgi:hypothetical protein
MLRTLVIASVLLVPGLAMAEALPESPMGLAVRAEGNVTLAQVEAVERNSEGRIMAVQAPGLEPADAPSARQEQLIAQNDDNTRALRSIFRGETAETQVAARSTTRAR